MEDLFNRAVRSIQSHPGDSWLNFRRVERHMSKEFSGKSGGYAEFAFKMEAHMSILNPAKKGGEVLRATALEPKYMNEDEVRALGSICWKRASARR